MDDENESHLLPIPAPFSHLHQKEVILSQLSLGVYFVSCTVASTEDTALTEQMPLHQWRTINSLLGLAKPSNSETQSTPSLVSPVTLSTQCHAGLKTQELQLLKELS